MTGAALVNTPKSTIMYGGHFRDSQSTFSVGDTIRQFTRNDDGKLHCKMVRDATLFTNIIEIKVNILENGVNYLCVTCPAGQTA